jgi:hypothetical protein
MATILFGDIQVDYLADNRQKRMSWLGGTNDSYTMNELYSAMATLLDETTTIDSGTAFSAETPVEYTTGKIDSGDAEPWFITFDLMEKITGGALRTSGWTRVTDTNTGIIVVPVDPDGTIVLADEGYTVSGATTGSGTLLEFIDTGSTYDYLVIRPDSDAAADDFTTGAQLITSARGAFTADQWASAYSTTGEMIWANLYSIGTIDANVHLYLYQGIAADDVDRTRVYSWNDATQDWYGNGHIDICVALKDVEQATWATIDDGYITVFARKYGDLYANFEVSNSTTSGGRNPIPLQTSADLDNTTGYKTVTTGAFSATPLLFTIGEIITEAVSGARGIVTDQVLDTSITYIPIDDPQIAFFSSTAQLITGATSGYTATSSGDATSGPATAAWFTNNTTPTATFTYATFDVDDDGTDESYGVTIDCQSNPLTEVYEWLKYATRNGEITNDLDDINGERYIGGEVYLEWTGAVSGTISEDSDVSQANTGATGVIIAYDETDKIMLLRDARGTFNTTDIITDNDSTGTVIADADAVTFAPKTASPLGTFAGGTFFGARGVLLSTWISADENAFQLTPIEGGTKERPQAFSIEVTNLEGGAETSALHDRVSVFRLDGAAGSIEKTEYDAAGGETPGDPTLVVTGGIAQDVPGKSTGGWLVLVDDPAGAGDEYKIRYDSWVTSTFTLSNVAAFVTTDTNNDTRVEYDGGSFITDVKRGDLVYNSTEGLVGYVKTVDSDTVLTLEGTGILGNTTGDTVEINCVPITVISADDVYVPFIDKIAAATEESVSIIYVSPIYFRVKVRNTRAATPIKPYSSDGSSTGTDQSIPVIRAEDTIITT